MTRRADHLDRIEINSPCNADWNSMTGNDRVRFCTHCNLHVHNLSMMKRSEAIELVAKSGGRLCARFYRRPDGTVQTAPHPGQLHHIARRASRIAAGAFGAILSLSGTASAQNYSSAGELLQGKPMVRADGTRPVTPLDGVSAAISGRVFDPQRVVIAGATVTLVNQGTGLEQTTNTNEDGIFRFQSLAAGSYTLRVYAAGFLSRTIEDIYLYENTEQQIEATLEMGLMGDVAIALPDDLLIKAAWENNLVAVKELLAKGVKVNVVEDYFGTALAQAVGHGNVEMVSALLWAGADVNAKNIAGRTALMYLDEDGSAEVVKALLAAGAQIDLQDVEGNTALLLAASARNTDALKALLDAGANVNAKNKEGRTALMQAADVDLLDNVRALIVAGAEINARDKHDSTALILTSDTEVKELLESYGAIE